jgi:hypothetical protein
VITFAPRFEKTFLTELVNKDNKKKLEKNKIFSCRLKKLLYVCRPVRQKVETSEAKN